MSETPTWAATAPFFDFLEIEVVRAEAGEAELAFQSRPELTNRKGDIHGGVLTALIDLAASQATRSLGEVKGVATMTLTTSFLAAAQGRATARAKVMKGGKSTSFVDVKVFDETGEIAATGSVLLRIIR